MSCAPITPSRFKQIKPQFASVDDAVVQSYIDLGTLWVDESWPERLCEAAQVSIVCHLMTLDGLGSDTESQGQASGAAQYQTVKSGELTLTRFQKSAADMSYADWLGQTKCGAFFMQLLRMARGGPRIAMGGCGGAQSGFAKDVPFSPPWGYQ